MTNHENDFGIAARKMRTHVGRVLSPNEVVS